MENIIFFVKGKIKKTIDKFEHAWKTTGRNA